MRLIPIAALLSLAACSDVVAPPSEQMSGPEYLGMFVGVPTAPAALHVLHQSASAPLLQKYQVSFWARRDRPASVSVNYLPEAGQSSGKPFLRFDIPRDGLQSVPGDERFSRRDSVYITLTIDPQNFSVDFQPSGVVFNQRNPATLVVWYGNADPDFNGDGVMDGVDQALAAAMSIWGREEAGPWLKMLSNVDASQPFVMSAVRHFSQYAVSW